MAQTTRPPLCWAPAGRNNLISTVLIHLSSATTWTDIASGRSRDGTDHSTTTVLGACIWCHSSSVSCSIFCSSPLSQWNVSMKSSWQLPVFVERWLAVSLGTRQVIHVVYGDYLYGEDRKLSCCKGRYKCCQPLSCLKADQNEGTPAQT